MHTTHGLKSCTQLEARTDRYIKRMLLINSEQSIPRTDNDLLDYCKSTRKGFALATKYQQCLPPFPRQILALMLNGAGKAVRYICDDNSRRSQVLDYLTCLKTENIGRVHSLVGRTLSIMDYIGTNVTSDVMILPYSCCTYHFLYDRSIRLLNTLCPDKSASVTQLIGTLLELTLSEVIDIGCSKYSTLSTCVAKIPQAMENIKSARSSSNKSLEDRSFVEPILRISNRLIDDPTKEDSNNSKRIGELEKPQHVH
uniref:Uncharacterized protein n=1 Tax=Tetranychus urticae TaxID=32264 RepID=T1JR06_TETUR